MVNSPSQSQSDEFNEKKDSLHSDIQRLVKK